MLNLARRVGVVVIVVLTASSVWAQAPATLARVTVSDDVAKRTLVKNQVNAATARQLVDACVEFANRQTPPGNYAIFVLAPNGDLIESHVMDGVLPIGVETGLLKAKTALYARSPSSAVAQRFNNVDGRLIRLDLGKEQGLAYYFVGGGLPIVVEDQLIGAISAGGGNMDEQCVYAALTKVLGPQPPLPAPPPADGGRGGRGAGAPAGGPPAAGRGN
ncbi:MAG: heme-binding protein [Vicinamibacterales bacterium]